MASPLGGGTAFLEIEEVEKRKRRLVSDMVLRFLR